MAKVLVCYYSRTGNTEKMARIIAENMAREGLTVDIKSVEETTPEDLLAYDGLVFGSPTYYGTMAWPVKKLLDESVKYHGKMKGKVGGAFSSAANVGGGNETTILDILKAMLIHGMVIQGETKGDHYGPVSIKRPDRRATKCCEQYARTLADLVKKLYPSSP